MAFARTTRPPTECGREELTESGLPLFPPAPLSSGPIPRDLFPQTSIPARSTPRLFPPFQLSARSNRNRGSPHFLAKLSSETSNWTVCRCSVRPLSLSLSLSLSVGICPTRNRSTLFSKSRSLSRRISPMALCAFTFPTRLNVKSLFRTISPRSFSTKGGREREREKT